MTWKEFKECVERQGLRDEHVIRYIDWNAWSEPRVDLHMSPDEPTSARIE